MFILFPGTLPQVEVSLFSCIFVGACIVAGSLRDGFKDSLSVYLLGALFDEDHVLVILFTLFLSGLVGMMEKSGGMIGFTTFVSKFAKTQRSGQFTVYITSCMVFFDDYTNILLTGETMKPLTDLVMVSREKLAFIVDATASSLASISPISSWVGFEIGLIVQEVVKLEEKFGAGNLTISTSGLGIFLQSVKYCYYQMFMIFLIFCIIGFKRDFGPMLIAERKVAISQRTDGGDGKAKQHSSGDRKENQPDQGAPLHAFNMLIPVIVLVCTLQILGVIARNCKINRKLIDAPSIICLFLQRSLSYFICWPRLAKIRIHPQIKPFWIKSKWEIRSWLCYGVHLQRVLSPWHCMPANGTSQMARYHGPITKHFVNMFV